MALNAKWVVCLLLICTLSGLAQEQPANQAAARSLLQAGKAEEAIAMLKQLEAQAGTTSGLNRDLGTAYYKASNFANSATYLKRSLAENPDDKEVVQLLGLSYYFIGKPGDAIPLLEKVQSWMPVANVDASYVLGVCYIQTFKYDQARKAFSTMYGVPADSAASHLFLARMLLRQEFDPVAEEHARKAVELDPKLPMAHLLLGELYTFKSRIPEAIAEFEKELSINPGHAATYYKLADALTRVDRFEEAHRLLQRSIWLDSTASGPFILMGKVLLKKKENDLAARTLRRALQMDPNNFIAHHLLGQAFRALGNEKLAEEQFKKAERLQTGLTSLGDK